MIGYKLTCFPFLFYLFPSNIFHHQLEAMGFDRAIVLEVFFACNKNEELAANYLLDHMHEFEDWFKGYPIASSLSLSLSQETRYPSNFFSFLHSLPFFFFFFVPWRHNDVECLEWTRSVKVGSFFLKPPLFYRFLVRIHLNIYDNIDVL